MSRGSILALVLGLLIATGVGYGYWEATRPPRVIYYHVVLADWPAEQPSLRIVQLSDTHAVGPDMPTSRLDAIVEQVNRLQPDLVALTGDYVSDKSMRSETVPTDAAVAPFGRLRARLGVYAVLGNHDWERDGPGMRRALRRNDIHVLDNEAVAAGPLIVAGVDDEWHGRANLDRTLSAVERAAGRDEANPAARKPILLLSHSPDIFPQVPASVDLTLAGHTHGGQIAPPVIGPLVTASRFGRRYAHGHMVERGRHLIVSAGIGTSILPLRLGVPPEIVVISLGGG